MSLKKFRLRENRRRLRGARRLESSTPAKMTLLLALLVASLAAADPGPALGRTINVPADYFTIQEAVDAASAGDKVEVANGTYRQAVVLRTGITLESVGGRDSCTIIPPEDAWLLIAADSLTEQAVVRGFTIDGQYKARIGIRAVACEVDILDNRFDNLVTSISLMGCPQGLVARNEILRSRSAAILCSDSSPMIVGNVIRYSGDYSIAILGKESQPVIGGSRGRANTMISYKGSVDVGNGSPNPIDARYNDWGVGTAVEMNTKGYPADISVIQDVHDSPKNGLVDYRHWEGQPMLDSLLSEPERLILPAVLAVILIVAVAVTLTRRRRAAEA